MSAAAAGDRREGIAGALLGTALGDAVGLPREGLSPRRARRLCGGPPLGQRLVLGRGLVSDDTEHTCMVGQALLASGGEPDPFARSLAWRLRGWLLGLPAGVGFATLRALLKLWLGFPPGRSGVFSAGNGPAMRAPLLGACFPDDPARLRALVRASTRLTHTDPKAEEGAWAVAHAAARGARAEGPADPAGLIGELLDALEGDELRRHLERAAVGLEQGEPLEAYAEALGLAKGVTGYVNHTVPVALYACLAHPGDYRGAVEGVILLGGDADTTGAIAGGVAGAAVGGAGLPVDWLAGLVEWPRSVAWQERLADALAVRFGGDAPASGPGPVPLFWPAIPARNLAFLLIVLAHGFRRLLPPY